MMSDRWLLVLFVHLRILYLHNGHISTIATYNMDYFLASLGYIFYFIAYTEFNNIILYEF